MNRQRIIDKPPQSWRDLQSYVAQVFSEIGCRVDVDRTKQLPRGTVELDVVVRDTTTVPHSLYICECKHWAKRVPKAVVHSFRTVVSELGANRGFLISRNGFQAGAREAAAFTNIDLLTWTEFEDLMFERWLAGVTCRLDPLFVRAHALMDPSDEDLWKGRECTSDSWKKWDRIAKRYPLITVWALFNWHSKVGLKAIPTIGIRDETTNFRPQVLDTYRKVVDRAPHICRAAYEELSTFWSRMRVPPQRR